MNEERSDVRFIVEGKPIPALKSFLSVRSRVFHAMFSGEFKESKDKEVVIEDTTYEAFKTFIRFVYCDDLGLKTTMTLICFESSTDCAIDMTSPDFSSD